MDVEKIDKCIGDPEADEDNPVLKAEQDAQVDWKSFTFLIGSFLIMTFELTFSLYIMILLSFVFRLVKVLVEMSLSCRHSSSITDSIEVDSCI